LIFAGLEYGERPAGKRSQGAPAPQILRKRSEFPHCGKCMKNNGFEVATQSIEKAGWQSLRAISVSGSP
jgi:galactose-1-phosphate uridylyltransferase